MFKRFLDWWRSRKKDAQREEGQQLYIADLEFKMAREHLCTAKAELRFLRLQLSETPDSHRLRTRLSDAEKDVREAESRLEWRRGAALYRRSRFKRRWKVPAMVYDWSAV